MSEKTTKQIDENELMSFQRFAERLCDLAAIETLTHFRQNPDIENKSGYSPVFDPVTLADKNAESVIIDEIKKTYPDHSILAEESGTQKNTSSYQWVIDPIDGTGAFVSGIPLWGTLIALLHDDSPVLGIMDQPYLKERYLAWADNCFLTKGTEPMKNISTSPCMALENARLATTSPELFAADERAIFNTVRKASKLTRYGTDCSAYALLASGHIDLVIESGLNAYDICALIPIIEGAGGVITTWQNEPATNGGQIIAAASRELHKQALNYLK